MTKNGMSFLFIFASFAYINLLNNFTQCLPSPLICIIFLTNLLIPIHVFTRYYRYIRQSSSCFISCVVG